VHILLDKATEPRLLTSRVILFSSMILTKKKKKKKKKKERRDQGNKERLKK
jgi:hypothetical protein